MARNAKLFDDKKEAEEFCKKINGFVVRIENETLKHNNRSNTTYKTVGWWAYAPVDIKTYD